MAFLYSSYWSLLGSLLFHFLHLCSFSVVVSSTGWQGCCAETVLSPRDCDVSYSLKVHLIYFSYNVDKTYLEAGDVAQLATMPEFHISRRALIPTSHLSDYTVASVTDKC